MEMEPRLISSMALFDILPAAVASAPSEDAVYSPMVKSFHRMLPSQRMATFLQVRSPNNPCLI